MKRPTTLPCLNHNLRLIDLAMSRLAFVLNIKPQEGKPFFFYTHYFCSINHIGYTHT